MTLEEKFIILSFILGSLWGIFAWELCIKQIFKKNNYKTKTNIKL